MPDMAASPVFANAPVTANNMAISKCGSPAQTESPHDPGFHGASDVSCMAASTPWNSCQNSFRILKGMPMNSLLHTRIKGNFPPSAASMTECLKTVCISTANSSLKRRGYRFNSLEYEISANRVRKFMTGSRMFVALLW